MAEPVGDPVVDPNPNPDPSPADAPRSFSQADVDRIVQDRFARVKADPPADYAELREKAKQLADLEAANKTELEKAQERADNAEAAATKIRDAANARMVEAAVLSEATRQKAMKPEHLHRLINTETVTVGDDGQVTGVEDAVKAFLDANPEYVGTGRAAGSADQGARGGGNNQLTREQLNTMSPEQIVKAENEGRLSDLLAGKST